MKHPSKKRLKRIQLPSGLAGRYEHLDGHDPRFDYQLKDSEETWGASSSGKERRKLRQLCCQVMRVLSLAWPDDHVWLSATHVHDVLPAPNSHNLLVMVSCSLTVGQLSDEQILNALVPYREILRRHVAEGINRKRTPQLSFAVLPRSQNAC